MEARTVLIKAKSLVWVENRTNGRSLNNNIPAVKDHREAFKLAILLEDIFSDGHAEKTMVNVQFLKAEKDAVVKVESVAQGSVYLADSRQSNGKNFTTFSDNSRLQHLNVATVIKNLKYRYQQGQIYTLTGSLLLSVNPYSEVPQIFDIDEFERQREASKSTRIPHLYTVLEKSLREMKLNGKSHSLLINGESGSGKTETCKYAIQYLSKKTGTSSQVTLSSETDLNLSESLRNQLIGSSSYILESFGNAKTHLNDNSSRFGKCITLQYSTMSERIEGASITTYLLERSRICFQDRGEGNFHIFYQICDNRGSLEKTLQLGLREASSFRYLAAARMSEVEKQEEVIEEDEEGDSDDIPNSPLEDQNAAWVNLLRSVESYPILRESWEDIIRILTGILHLGEIDFKDIPFDREERSTIDKQGENKAVAVECIYSLLGFPNALLEEALCVRTLLSNSSKLVSNNSSSNVFASGGPSTPETSPERKKRVSMPKRALKMHECYSARDSLAKFLYNSLFDWILRAINDSMPTLSVSQTSASESSSPTTEAASTALGKVVKLNLLDLPGFESSPDSNNSLEQLLINYGNEKMQKFFLSQAWTRELELYRFEGINCGSQLTAGISDEAVAEKMVQKVIDLYEDRNNGIFNLLSDEAKLPDPSSKHFASTLHHLNTSTNSNNGEKNAKSTAAKESFSSLGNVRKYLMRSDEAFVINHYAGPVCYNASSMISKNNTNLHPDLQALLSTSENPFIREQLCASVGGATLSIPSTAVGKREKSNSGTATPTANTNNGSGVSSGANTPSATLSMSAPTSACHAFKLQFTDLLKQLSNSECSFIRCLKPNMTKKALEFNESIVLNQLRCAGLFQVISLMGNGFPCRIPYSELESLLERVRVGLQEAAAPESEGGENIDSSSKEHINNTRLKITSDLKTFCQALLQFQSASEVAASSAADDGEKSFAFGTTQLFLKPRAFEKLEVLINQCNNAESGKALLLEMTRWSISKKWKRLYTGFKVASYWRKLGRASMDRRVTVLQSLIRRKLNVSSLENFKAEKRLLAEAEEEKRKKESAILQQEKESKESKESLKLLPVEETSVEQAPEGQGSPLDFVMSQDSIVLHVDKEILGHIETIAETIKELNEKSQTGGVSLADLGVEDDEEEEDDNKKEVEQGDQKVKKVVDAESVKEPTANEQEVEVVKEKIIEKAEEKFNNTNNVSLNKEISSSVTSLLNTTTLIHNNSTTSNNNTNDHFQAIVSASTRNSQIYTPSNTATEVTGAIATTNSAPPRSVIGSNVPVPRDKLRLQNNSNSAIHSNANNEHRNMNMNQLISILHQNAEVDPACAVSVMDEMRKRLTGYKSMRSNIAESGHDGIERFYRVPFLRSAHYTFLYQQINSSRRASAMSTSSTGNNNSSAPSPITINNPSNSYYAVGVQERPRVASTDNQTNINITSNNVNLPSGNINSFLYLHYRGKQLCRQIELVPKQFAILMDRQEHGPSVMSQLKPNSLRDFDVGLEISGDEYDTVWCGLKLLQVANEDLSRRNSSQNKTPTIQE